MKLTFDRKRAAMIIATGFTKLTELVLGKVFARLWVSQRACLVADKLKTRNDKSEDEKMDRKDAYTCKSSDLN